MKKEELIQKCAQDLLESFWRKKLGEKCPESCEKSSVVDKNEFQQDFSKLVDKLELIKDGFISYTENLNVNIFDLGVFYSLFECFSEKYENLLFAPCKDDKHESDE